MAKPPDPKTLEIAALKAEIAQLKAEIARLQVNNLAVSEDLAKAGAEIDRLRSNLRAAADAHDKLVAEIERLMAATPKWRPIETPPPDGAAFLGYEAYSDGVIMTVMMAANGTPVDTLEGWPWRPSHWMPLPPQPEGCAPVTPALAVGEIISRVDFVTAEFEDGKVVEQSVLIEPLLRPRET